MPTQKWKRSPHSLTVLCKKYTLRLFEIPSQSPTKTAEIWPYHKEEVKETLTVLVCLPVLHLLDPQAVRPLTTLIAQREPWILVAPLARLIRLEPSSNPRRLGLKYQDVLYHIYQPTSATNCDELQHDENEDHLLAFSDTQGKHPLPLSWSPFSRVQQPRISGYSSADSLNRPGWEAQKPLPICYECYDEGHYSTVQTIPTIVPRLLTTNR